MTWSGGGPEALWCYFLDRDLVLLEQTASSSTTILQLDSSRVDY